MSTILPSVSSTKSGVLSTGTQTVAGDKSFTGNVTFSGTVAGVTAAVNNVEINYVAFPSSIGTGGGQWTKTGTTGAGTNSPTTTSTAGDLPLGGVISTAIQMVTGASNGAEASHYTSCTFTTSASGSAKMKVEFFMRPGTNFASNEWTVSVYQSTTRQTLSTDSSGVTYLPNATGKFTTTFDAVASTAYTLRFARVSGTTAATLNVANVIVGTGIQPQGAVVGPWISYSPTVSNFGTVTSATHEYRRVGDSIQFRGKFTTGTTVAAEANISLPPGIAISGTNPALSGRWKRNSASATTVKSGPLYITSNIYFSKDDYTTANSPFVTLNGNAIAGNTEIFEYVSEFLTVNEWAGSGTINLAQNDVEYGANSQSLTTAGATASASNTVYGQSGTLIQSVNSTTTTGNSTTIFPVILQRPLQQGDVPKTEIFVGNGWIDSTALFPFVDQGTARYGIKTFVDSTTQVSVAFGNAGAQATGSFGAQGTAWSVFNGVSYKWRVTTTRAGVSVGFGRATGSSSGLVTSYSPTVLNSNLIVSSADSIVTVTDGYANILVTTGSSDRTINLPAAASSNGRTLLIKKMDSGTGKAIVDPNASETVDGLTTFPLSFQYQSVKIVCDGTNWLVSEYPNKYYVHLNDDNASGQGAVSESQTTAFTAPIVPYAAIYKITWSFMVYSAPSSDAMTRGEAYIKTGNASYASATYRVHAVTGGSATRSGNRAFDTVVAQWIGPLSAGDTIHAGIAVIDITSTGGHAQHFLSVEEIRRN